jgi:hypothetical protein
MNDPRDFSQCCRIYSSNANHPLFENGKCEAYIAIDPGLDDVHLRLAKPGADPGSRERGGDGRFTLQFSHGQFQRLQFFLNVTDGQIQRFFSKY